MDQLNPAGFNVPNVLIRNLNCTDNYDVAKIKVKSATDHQEDSRFIPAREIGNLETNMAEADLSPMTFTSRSSSDPHYDISTEDSSENENVNTYTEAFSDNSSSDPETESSAKSEVRRSSTMPKTKPKPI